MQVTECVGGWKSVFELENLEDSKREREREREREERERERASERERERERERESKSNHDYGLLASQSMYSTQIWSFGDQTAWSHPAATARPQECLTRCFGGLVSEYVIDVKIYFL